MKRHWHKLWLLAGMLVLVMLNGCAPNKAYRTAALNPSCPEQGCTDAVIEQHKTYDLAFVEFTDQGNVFDRQKMEDVLRHVEKHAKHPDGASVFLYVHGWQHNASPTSSNVRSFRKKLHLTAQHKTSKRRIIGIYVGWRGLSATLTPFKFLSYWSRKNVGRNVGDGGMTELLVRLDRITSHNSSKNSPKNSNPNKNLFVMTGHSFGGMALLAATNNILIERIANAEQVPCTDNPGCNTCYKSKPFGHGIVLLNPAVEANEILPLKELITHQHCFAEEQPKLLHIISSEADFATNTAFKTGQYLGVSLQSSELELKRQYHGQEIPLHEHALNTITVGNFPGFRTGLSRKRNADAYTARLCRNQDGDREECYIACEGQHECVAPEERSSHFTVFNNDPLHFLYTDRHFISSHSDVFNDTVQSYVAAISYDAQYKRLLDAKLNPKTRHGHIPRYCLDNNGKFNFSDCLDGFKGKLATKPEKQQSTHANQ